MGNTADTSAAATAAHSATSSDRPISGPARADPMGLPTELRAIDTANARPNHMGSVRLWRSVNNPMSNGPMARPNSAIAIATTSRFGDSGRSAVATVATRIEATIICRSRPWLAIRPARRADTSPAPPISPPRRPTVDGPEWNRPRTSTGTAMAINPFPMLNVLSVSARPRSVGLRSVYSKPCQALWSTEPTWAPSLRGSGNRSMTAAATR